jgi:plastocyanin
MPNRTAQLGDTVQYRDAKGKTHNVQVTGTQAGTGAAPSAPVVGNSGTGGTLTAATYSYRISAVKGGAESLASTAGTTVVGAGSTNICTITLPGAAGVQYAVYGRVGGSELFIGLSAVGATSFVDTGAVTPAGALPSTDGRVGVIQYHAEPDLMGLPGTAPILKATTVASTNAYFKY